jgi:Predicted AAA-ATPase/PD-(D/E)XK nuclease superfamily
MKKNVALIDKTLFIKEWMKRHEEVNVFLRPRRFGKSTNLSMLKSFFSIGAEAKDFSKYLIGKETKFIAKHCGKYPVVLLNMKDIRGNNWKEMLSELWLMLKHVIWDQASYLNSQDVDFIGINYRDAEAKPNKANAKIFLLQLTSCLYKKYNKRVVVLIDEYDAPLNHSFRKGFYEEASEFFGSFYSSGLKSNPALHKACLMGIVELQGGGILSGLNNLVVYACDKEKLSQYFGFTGEEITTFLNGNETQIKDALNWYNGYYMGSHQMVNPWSFMNYVQSHKLMPYWVQTANIDSIRTTITPVLSVKLIEILAQLYRGNEYEIGELSTKVNYGCSINLNLILSFFVHAGYLTYNKKKVSMPNQEIKDEWVNCSFGVTDSGSIDSSFQKDIMNALQSELFDVIALHTLMRRMLQSCSCFDTKNANSYHTFFLGIFIAVCGPKISSNRGSGHGCCDIAIVLEDKKRLFILEFKQSKTKDDLKKDAKFALNEIYQRKYYKDEQYCQWICIAIGVSFYQKEMSQLESEEFDVSLLYSKHNRKRKQVEIL